jgi:alkylation response protein AidB-like acyl-CoA dehydrogenase
MSETISETYSFEPVIEAFDRNPMEDGFLRQMAEHLAGADWRTCETDLERFGAWVVGEGRALTAESEKRHRHPRVISHDAWNRPVSDVEIPDSTRQLWSFLFGEGLGGARNGATLNQELVRYFKFYLMCANGEGGVMCPLTCTDGMVRALRAFPGDPGAALKEEIISRVANNSPHDYVMGAQFVTEIQAGSDAGTNQVEARPNEDGSYSLHGLKWFCSHVPADFYMVTARPAGAMGGAGGVAMFVVDNRNFGTARQQGYTLRRLKEKVGTRALATGEIDFHGAKAWPVGDLNRGLANMVAIVLTNSRINTALSSAGIAYASAMHARAYAGFRSAFGHRLEEYPLMAGQVEKMERTARAHTAGIFKVTRWWLERLHSGVDKAPRDRARLMIMAAKFAATQAGTRIAHDAIMTLGGNGIEEEFSVLPRLWRDAIIQETWEGPHNLMVTQFFKDLQRLYRNPEERSDWLGQVVTNNVRRGELADRMAELTVATMPDQRHWQWCHDLYDAFCAEAVEEIERLK